jgi:glycine cleavage system regulatory protein
MKKEIVVITVIGPDKIGIVQTISRTVSQHHANWVNSSMANLAGQFAGILEIEVDPDQRDALLNSLNSIEDSSLQIQTASPAPASATAQRQVTLELLGQDHPGIIHEITRVLTSLKLSIEELKTSTEDAPMSGGTLFRAFAILNIPENMSPDKIQDLQHELSQSLMIDVTIV